MDKAQLAFLVVFAIFGGILCDQHFGVSIPFFTISFLLVTGVLFYASQTKSSDEEE